MGGKVPTLENANPILFEETSDTLNDVIKPSKDGNTEV